MGSSYDRLLRPKPNTQWQNIENQTFIDHTQLLNVTCDKDEDDTADETECTLSVGICEDEGSDSEGEEESSGTDNEAKMGDERTWSDQHRLADGGGIVARFVATMEDQDPLHPDSISRLGQFFKLATLGLLEEASREVKGSRIILEDRSFSRKNFRPYPRSMTPKQLHEALAKQVRRNWHRLHLGLTTTQRYPFNNRPRPPNPVSVTTGTRYWSQSLRSGLSAIASGICDRARFLSEPESPSLTNTLSDVPKLWTESEDCQVERRTL